MLSRSQIKHIQSLERKKNRIVHQEYFVEGPKIVAEAIAQNASRIEIFATETWAVEQEALLQQYSPALSIISEKDLARISQLKTPNQVLALLPIEETIIPEKIKGINLFLENIQDPGNLGTIIRCADWFGAAAVYCSPNSADIYNSKVLQACMGSNFHISVHYIDAEELIGKLDIPVYGATISGENLYKLESTNDAFILIGNESKGLSEALLSFCNKKISIPKRGKAESLNAANATAVILSHFASKII